MFDSKQITLFVLFVLWQFHAAAQYGGGSGTSQNPYLIKTANHLVTLNTTPSDWTGKYFKLSNDINMAGKTFTPIGNAAQLFNGTFDGNHKVITNLTVTAGTSADGTGLFGTFKGYVNNLGIENISINAFGISKVGGIVGYMTGGTVTDCYTKGGSIDVGNGGWAGGIVGVMWNADVSYVKDCYSSVAITASWGSGGIVGATRGPNIIKRVVFYGTITNNPAITTVQNDPADNNKNGIVPTKAYFAVSTGASDTNATSLNTTNLAVEGSYSTFDFTNDWMIQPELEYAVLKGFLPDLNSQFFDNIENQRVVSDQNIEWKNFGPGMSGYCEEVWCHPTDKNIMFLGPDMHVTYGTWDGGATWQTIKDSDGNGMDMRRVLDIEFSLQNLDYAVALDWEGQLYESNDRGKTWSFLTDVGGRHTELAIHPNNDNIWFVGAGDFWNVKDNHKTLAQPHGIKHSTADYGYVWKTTNKGTSWTKVATNISPDLDVAKILFNPHNPDSMAMATSHGIYVSSNGGNNWVAGGNGLPNNLPRDMTSFYNSNTQKYKLYAVEQTVYEPNGTSIISKGGVYRSDDGGLNWINITGNLGIDLSVITNYNVRDRYHKTVSHWLGISKSTSTSTYTTYPSQALSVYNRIVINPYNRNEIYISHNKKHDKGFGPGDVWKTLDGGNTWTACARNGAYWINETDKAYWQAKGNDIGTNMEFAHLQDYMDEESEGSGTRMMEINAGGELIIGVDQQTLRSTDKGVSWQQIDDDETALGSNRWIGRGDSNLPGRFMLLETGVTGRKLFCSGEHGLWQSASLGSYPDPNAMAVEQIEGQVHDNSGNVAAHSVSTVAVHPNNPNKIYMLSWRQEHRGKLRRTTDGGQTWQNIATIFEANNNEWEGLAPQYSLTIDPVTPNNMYFCSIYKTISEISGGTSPALTKGAYGVYRSSDGGFTWNVSTTGFPQNASVRRIAMHPDNPSVFYAALNQFGNNDPGGLYISTDKTVTWSQVMIPSEIKSVNNVFIDRNTKYLYISCGARSGALYDGGVWRSKDDGVSWEKIFRAPYVWQTEVSPANPNIIVISVPAQTPNYIDNFKNPGIYLSQDGGVSWAKINKGIGQPDKMVDAKPDPEDENLLWCAGWGSGWFKTAIQNLGGASSRIAGSQDLVLNKEVDLVNKVQLYPNPITDGNLKVVGLEPDAHYTILNINGQVVASGTITASQIEVNQLISGFYIIHISDSQKSISQKVLIKK
ncbi:T9SS type A sorting domain-containing protein [Limibacter armeniacum]|uniref:VPS10 domain-containing protein n=1 Tax=Limibacter armeniacum TaxID=466084 RepID=UPI002FE52EA3